MARIVQLSDLHLTASGRAWRTDVWRGFERVLEALPSHEPFDRLVLTGDLANRPSVAAYRRLADALRCYHERLLLVPGNHDGRSALRQVFGAWFGAHLRFVDEVDGWRLIGLDSKRTLRVHGRLGAEQLDWLSAELGHDAPTLLFLHHPVVPVGTWWLDRDRLRDRAALARVLRDRGAARVVRALLHGHVHQPFEGTFAEVPVQACPSTAYQFAPASRWPGSVARRAPAFRVLDLAHGSLRSRVVSLPRS